MKANIMKLLTIFLMLGWLGTGAAVAGAYKSSYKAPAHRGYYHGGGGDHHRSHHRYSPGYRLYWPHRHSYYGPPVRYYHHSRYIYGGCGRYNGAYYFSGAFSEPGFGFVFGTRGSW
jgi:hypothetical protein